MKAWGLQFEKRVKDFSHEVITSRTCVTRASEELRHLAREVTVAKTRADESEKYYSVRRKALDKLIDLGPEGLARWEGEDGPEFTLQQFVERMEKPAA